ncbi:hypothetical protein F4818DRAFT_345532 [Hypoxylon cercidicola]|nr:hypothetical protein F4818DRAFT_345532 [Hypoxylon cercidicola]
MKNFGTIIMALAAGASIVATMPHQPVADVAAVQARVPHDVAYRNALEVRYPKHNKKQKGQQDGAAGNGTASAVDNGAAANSTADANQGNDDGKKKGKGEGEADAQDGDADQKQGGNALADLLGELLGGADKKAAAEKQGGIAALLQGLLG